MAACFNSNVAVSVQTVQGQAHSLFMPGERRAFQELGRPSNALQSALMQGQSLTSVSEVTV